MSVSSKSRAAIPNELTIAQINITSATSTTLVAGAANKKIRVWEVFLTKDEAMTIDFQDEDNNSFTNPLKASTLELVNRIRTSIKNSGFPVFEVPTAKGLKVVTVGTASNVRGWIAYTRD